LVRLSAHTLGNAAEVVEHAGMTLFEYISVAFSVVLSLSAAQLLGNIRSVLDPTRRDWVHGLWMVHLLILHVIVWWSGWALRDVQWNLGTFSLALSVPALLYVAANTLVSSDRSVSLREHFLTQRTLFFTARGLLVLASYAMSYLLLDTKLLVPARLTGVFILVICAVGIASANRRVQVTIAILGLLFEIFIIGYLRFEAGTWVRGQ
jgi:hypothetical protein